MLASPSRTILKKVEIVNNAVAFLTLMRILELFYHKNDSGFEFVIYNLYLELSSLQLYSFLDCNLEGVFNFIKGLSRSVEMIMWILSFSSLT